MISSRLPLIVPPILITFLLASPDLPKVRVEPNSTGPRTLEEQTRSSVVRDYLQAWQSLGGALSENQPDALDESFVGVAREKLADTIREQKRLGIQAAYRDQAHDLDIVFYSPDGLSIQLLDRLEYRLEIRDHGRVVGSRQVRARYVAVMTPTETRWKVRILQAEPE